MKKLLLAIGGLSLLGFGVYKYFKTQTDLLSKFTWKISGFKIVKFNLNELSIDVNFLFTSVADLEAKVTKLYLDLFLQDTNVGYIAENKEFIIPAHGTSSIPIHISINPQIVFKNLIDLSLGVAKSKDVRFKFKGFANVRSGFIATTIPIKYETSIKEYLRGIVPTNINK
jgi:hypothetical protein